MILKIILVILMSILRIIFVYGSEEEGIGGGGRIRHIFRPILETWFGPLDSLGLGQINSIFKP